MCTPPTHAQHEHEYCAFLPSASPFSLFLSTSSGECRTLPTQLGEPATLHARTLPLHRLRLDVLDTCARLRGPRNGQGPTVPFVQPQGAPSPAAPAAQAVHDHACRRHHFPGDEEPLTDHELATSVRRGSTSRSGPRSGWSTPGTRWASGAPGSGTLEADAHVPFVFCLTVPDLQARTYGRRCRLSEAVLRYYVHADLRAGSNDLRCCEYSHHRSRLGLN